MEHIKKRIIQTVSETVIAETFDIAKWFCSLENEQQAQFFLEVAKISETWDVDPFLQWYSVGKQLAESLKQNEEGATKALAMISDISAGIEAK